MPKILFLTAYPEEDASCRYRVHQFVPHLERAGYQCTIAPFASPLLFRALVRDGNLVTKAWETLHCAARRFVQLRNLSAYDLIVIHREAFPFFAPIVENWILQNARRTKVIFSFDDAIYAGHGDVSGLNHPLLYRWKHGRGYDDVIRGCSHVIAGNRILGWYASRLSPNVTIVPTVVDCEKFQFGCRNHLGPVTIGWIGSRTTAPYLRMIEPVLKKLCHSHGRNVRFRFFGHPEYKLDLPDFASYPFRLPHEVSDLQQLDIGLMPLPDNEWTRGKCAFKAIQYMASGVVAVASPVGVTTDLIQNGLNGCLALSKEDWFVTLDRLVRDRDLRVRITLEARRTVESSYSLEVWAPKLVSLFDQLCGVHSILEPQRVAA